MLGRDRIQEIANLWIAGYMGDAEETLGIVLPLAALHIALVGQKRGRLHEEDGKGPQGRIAIA